MKDSFGRYLGDQGPLKERLYDEHYYNVLEAKREEVIKENEGKPRPLTRKEMYEVQDEAVKRTNEDERVKQPVRSKGGGQQTSSGAGKSTGGAKTVEDYNRERLRKSQEKHLGDKRSDAGGGSLAGRALAFMGRALGPSEAHAAVNPKQHFDTAISFVLDQEGGYVNDSADRGGATNFGISSKANPDVDVENLTEDQAKKLYEERYWKASGADQLPYPLSLIHLDSAVHHGVAGANKLLELSEGDPKVYLALRKQKLEDIVERDASQKKFKKGWMNRVDKLKELLEG